jgi:hypothetical protein
MWELFDAYLTAVVNSANQITLTFSEALNPATVAAATLNGFSVAGGNATLTSMALAGGNTQLVLTGTNFVAGVTTVSYNAVTGVTDANNNKLADITARATTTP